MNCLVCGQPTRVIDSRMRIYGVRRRRLCLSCGARFTTVESPVVTVPRRSAAQYDRGTMSRSGSPRQTGE